MVRFGSAFKQENVIHKPPLFDLRMPLCTSDTGFEDQWAEPKALRKVTQNAWFAVMQQPMQICRDESEFEKY